MFPSVESVEEAPSREHQWSRVDEKDPPIALDVLALIIETAVGPRWAYFHVEASVFIYYPVVSETVSPLQSISGQQVSVQESESSLDVICGNAERSLTSAVVDGRLARDRCGQC